MTSKPFRSGVPQPDDKLVTISASSLDPEIRRLVLEAGAGKIQLTVVEDGNPVASIAPPESVQEWSADRQRFFDTIRDLQKTANLSPEEADELAMEAVESVRSATSS